MRAVETLIVFMTLMVLIIAAGGWAYHFALVQARAGEVRYAVGVMVQTAEAVNNMICSRGGSATIQFRFQYGGVVAGEEVSRTVTVYVGSQAYTPAPAQPYRYRVIQYFINQPLFTAKPIYDRGYANQSFYRIDRGEEPGIVYHYSEASRTYVVYCMQPFASVSSGGGKTTVHVTFVDFQFFATRGQSVVFTLANQTTSSLYVPISSNANVEVRFSDVGTPLSVGTLNAGDIMEVYVHQIEIGVSLAES